MFSLRLIKLLWEEHKSRQLTRKIGKSIDNLFKQIAVKKVITDEIVYYPQSAITRGVYKESRLPIIETKYLLKVTQIPCYPLEFQPKLRWYA